ncbi:talin-2-like [Ostrinia nubilalis]|uniref:talin-2-like n=1 Tax=Ostrinia nubilalis TaxID=29057 RepID=UPI0030823724
MAPLSLKIVLDEGAVTRTLKFESSTTVAAAQAQVKEKILTGDDGKVYGLFLTSADDERSGVWLEGHRQLDYYMLRDGDQLHYLCRMRNLRVRLLDGSVRTLQVDESKTVEELMVDICARLGITNHDEYGLCHDRETEQDENKLPAGTGTLTLKRVTQKKERDAKLEQLSKKIKTDDNVEWLEQKSTLRELGAGDAPLLLKRRLFYSDRNVDARDPVQLNLLYVQARDAILEGRHPVTEDQAVEFAGIQCQVHYGDFQEDKHKPGLIENLNEYLPEQYSGSWGAEKKILKEYRKHSGLSPIEAKYLYTKTARDLPTYGVTFFLVKEKQKGKKKLVPRLLGINAESILRLDEVTKEILQVWPLTQVKTYHAGKSETFTLNFGDYSDKEYSVKTNDAHRIRDILQGYIDLIRRRMEAKWQAESAVHHAVGEEYVEAGRGHLMEHIQHNSKALVEETFVGPSKIISYEPGQVITQGTQIMTVQQVVVTDKGSNRQNIVVGQVPMRRDMSLDFVRKLNKLNSNSVKIVSFLAEPSESNIEEARKLVKTMEADMPSIIDGVHESAKKQPTEEARKKLLDELQELCDCMKALSEATSADLNSEKAEDAAMRIADLSTQMYFSLDPRTLKRGELCRRSRNSFIQDDKMDATLRRASFIAAAQIACGTIDHARAALEQNYEGPILDASAVEELEKAAEAKMGKLNAAVALYLTAYADPKNVDYSAAVTSMNTINELLPELTKDAMMLSGVKDGNSRQDLLDEIKALCDAAKRVCLITDPDDHEKIQEAAYEYGRVSEKLMFTFRRKSPQRTSELVDLAKDIGRKTSFLVAGARDLAAMVSSEPAAAGVDEAGTRCADAAKDLLACATGRRDLKMLAASEPTAAGWCYGKAT